MSDTLIYTSPFLPPPPPSNFFLSLLEFLDSLLFKLFHDVNIYTSLIPALLSHNMTKLWKLFYKFFWIATLCSNSYTWWGLATNISQTDEIMSWIPMASVWCISHQPSSSDKYFREPEKHLLNIPTNYCLTHPPPSRVNPGTVCQFKPFSLVTVLLKIHMCPIWCCTAKSPATIGPVFASQMYR